MLPGTGEGACVSIMVTISDTWLLTPRGHASLSVPCTRKGVVALINHPEFAVCKQVFIFPVSANLIGFADLAFTGS